MRIRGNLFLALLAGLVAWVAEVDGAVASESGRLYLVDSQFTPLVTKIFEVDPASATLVLKGDLGVDYTPVLGMAAANALTFYLAGTDTSPTNACQGLRSCLLLKVVLDPASPTPALVQLVGVMKQDGNVVPEITGLTFRQDGQLYGISQTTYSLYRIDIDTAQATLMGSAGLELHGGDITFDAQDRLFAWTNIGAGSGVYLLDPGTGQASAYELHPGLDFAGMAALKHGNLVYGASAGTDQLYTLNLMGSISGLLMTLGGVRFDHARGDLDSPYCEDDASCADADVCTADSCSPGGCLHEAIAGCCVADSQCDDGNACTQEQCQNNQCVSSPINLDDGEPCTRDQCDPLTGPVHLAIEECCLSDIQCNDFNPCSRDNCVDNQCVHQLVLSCSPKRGTVSKEDRSGGP